MVVFAWKLFTVKNALYSLPCTQPSLGGLKWTGPAVNVPADLGHSPLTQLQGLSSVTADKGPRVEGVHREFRSHCQSFV
jgi:hypothetical protein